MKGGHGGGRERRVTVTKAARERARRTVAAALERRRTQRRQAEPERIEEARRRLAALAKRAARARACARREARELPAALERAREAAKPLPFTERGGDAIASVDAGLRPTRYVLELARPASARRIRARVARALGSEDFGLAPLFPRLGGSDPGLARFLRLELPITRRASRGIRYRVADRLLRSGAFTRVTPERLGLQMQAAGYDPDDLDYPTDTLWPLTSPVNRGANSDYRGFSGAVDVFGAWRLFPGNDAAAYGAGVTIGHPDTGFRVHTLVPEANIDTANAYNAFLGVTSPPGTSVEDNVARHPVTPRSLPFFVRHGTQTGAVMVAPAPGDAVLDPASAGGPNHEAPTASDGITDSWEDTADLQMAGVAPGARLLPLRCTDTVVLAGDLEILDAIEFAIEKRVDVISISLGGMPSPAMEELIQRAVGEDIIVIAAAGQTLPGEADWFGNAVVAPAAYPDCIAVGGSRHGDPWHYSHRGPEVDVCAPAWGVWTADFDSAGGELTRCLQGTSFSTAIVAGIAALWIAYHGRQTLLDEYPDTPLQEVFRHLLRSTARDPTPVQDPDPLDRLEWDTASWGAGIVDARELLRAPLPAPALIEGPRDSGFNLYRNLLGAGAVIDLNNRAVLDGIGALLAAPGAIAAAVGGALGAALGTAGAVAGAMGGFIAQWTDPDTATAAGARAFGGFAAGLGGLAPALDAAGAAEDAARAWEEALAVAMSVGGEVGEWAGDRADEAEEAWEAAEDAAEDALEDTADAVDELIEGAGDLIEDAADSAGETGAAVVSGVVAGVAGLFG